MDTSADDQNTTLEAATGVLSPNPPSLAEPFVANESDPPTLVEGVSPAASFLATPATLVASNLVPEEQEHTSVEVKDVEPAPVLDGQTNELTEVGVDIVREEPKVGEETQATDSHPDVIDGVGNDIAPTPTTPIEAELPKTNEEATPRPSVESVLASTPAVIEHLVVPDAEESKTLETVEEVEAAGDGDSQPILSEELVTEAEADAPLVDPVAPAPDIFPACDSETMETPAEEPSAPGVENLSTEAEAETVEDLVLPQDPITEINEPTSLQVEESQIAELEPVLVDAAPIEVESLTQKAPTVESENVEPVANAPPFEEPVVTEDALVEDAQHEESTLSHDVQEEIVPEVNPIDASGVLKSQESIGAEEPDTSPIVVEDSAPVVENQLVDKSAPSDGSAVEDSKIEVEESIIIDAPIIEDSLAVVETPLLVTPSVTDEPEFVVDANIAEGTTSSSFLYYVNIFDLKCSDFSSAPELTSESEALSTGGGIDSTISEVLEVSKGDLDFLVYLNFILTSIPRFR